LGASQPRQEAFKCAAGGTASSITAGTANIGITAVITVTSSVTTVPVPGIVATAIPLHVIKKNRKEKEEENEKSDSWSHETVNWCIIIGWRNK
jgi:hypothetical protein